MPLNVASLWDYRKPEVSEQRFRQALTDASAEDVLVLQTQIARTYGLRRDFVRAREILAAIEQEVERGTSEEARVRYFLELGRTYASATHPPEADTPENKEAARTHYLKAFEVARRGQLDNLAIDALHMMAFVDTDPGGQLKWDLEAIEYMEKSSQPEALAWEGALRNNVGYALQLLGRYDEALVQFRLSLAAHERTGRGVNVRIAHWMIAKVLRLKDDLAGALEIQLRLEREWDAAGEPDPYVYEELEQIYRALGDAGQADAYAERLRASKE